MFYNKVDIRFFQYFSKEKISFVYGVFCKAMFLLLVILSYTCSGSGDDFQTFLEKNDGSEWQLKNDSLMVFIRINNNSENLIEQWYYQEEMKCYDYNSNIFVPGDCEIRENSFDCFVIEGDMIISDYETMTFVNQGDFLRVDIKFSEWENETVYFTKSLISFEDFKICKPLNKGKCAFYSPCN
jgi:hypothetical protein